MVNNHLQDDPITQQAVNAKYDQEIRANYAALFRSPMGRKVLRDILDSCYFPGSRGGIYMSIDPDNKEMIGRFNAGLEIAEKAGILNTIGVQLLGIFEEVQQ